MPVKRVLPAEAHRLLGEGYTFVDVRSVPEYDQGHPDGAVNVPLMHMVGGRMAPNPEFLAVMAKAFPRDSKLVLGCRSGGRSLQAATLLQSAGFTDVLDMRGGWGGEMDMMGRAAVPGWQSLGLPASTAAPPGGSWEELKRK